jgi:hypothetical protein
LEKKRENRKKEKKSKEIGWWENWGLGNWEEGEKVKE